MGSSITMMRCVFLIVLGVFTLPRYMHTIDGFTSEAGSSVHQIIQFLHIQNKTCGEIRWCTIQEPREEHGDLSRFANQSKATSAAPCCKGCSCEQRCEGNDSCCPDYYFGKYNNWKTFDSIPEFIDTFLNWASSENSSRNTAIQMIDNEGTHECLRVQVQGSSKYREDAGSYIMTAKCSWSYPDGDIKEKCEYDFFSTSANPNLLPSYDDLVPVQSLFDGTIYKNRHCSACNSEQDISPWTVSLLCSNEQVPTAYVEHFPNPTSILRAMLTHEHSTFDECNILFASDQEHATAIHNRRCIKYDFDNCPNETSIESQICKEYTSPVHVYSKDRELTVYKNAACLDCNGRREFDDICSTLSQLRRLKMNMHVPKEMAAVSIKEHVHDLLSVTFPGNSGSICTVGEVYDAVAEICRKIICPKGMFAFQGKCHFFFTQIHGGKFVVLLKLIPTTPINNYTEFASLLYDDFVILDKKDPTILITDQSVWYQSATDFLVYSALSVDDTNGTYSDVINFIKSLQTTPRSLYSGTGVITVDVVMANSVKYTFRKYLDLRSGEYYSLVYPISWRKKQVKVILNINEDNFCYRVLLNEGEYSLRGISLVIKSTKTVVYDYVTYANKTYRNVLVCMEHVFRGTRIVRDNTQTKIAPVEDLTREHTEPTSSGGIAEIAITPVLLVLTVALAIMTFAIRSRQVRLFLQQRTPQ